MEESKIQEFVSELCKLKITKKSYDGSNFDCTVIDRDGKIIVEEAMRNFLLDNRDDEIGILKAKVFAYEQIISNSNFAPIIKTIKTKTI